MDKVAIFAKRALFASGHGKGLLGKADLLSKLFLISQADRPIALDIKDVPHPLYVQSGSDVAMVIEVFHDHEYDFKEAKNITRIIDIGANIGSASLYFASQYPGAEIISIEPDPQNISKLELNTKPYKNIKIIKGAVDISVGERTFYSDRNVGMSSSFTKRSDSQCTYTVKTFTLNTIPKEENWDTYDLLKFDVEGAEWSIFSQRPIFLPTYIIGEYHEDLVGKSVDEFIRLFPEYTVEKKHIAPQRYILKLVKKVS